MAQPIFVQLVFHPQSEEARELARSIHRTLNDDPAVPGLHVPTVFVEEDGTGFPPATDRFGEAERVFVAVLADDEMALEPEEPLPAGRKNWGEYVADLWLACEGNPSRRCVPFQISEHAHPLHEELSGVSFARAFGVPDEDRSRWVNGRLVLELVRFLKGQTVGAEDDAKAPVTVFLSHTKRDIERDPKVVETLINFFTHEKPVEVWFDSGDIEAGSVFAKKIEEGVRNAVLLVVLTDSYASREWCRKEVLLAKQLNRPLVVVDALQDREVRAFPYSGNVPVLRWQGRSQDALDLLLKETLRQLHVELELAGTNGGRILSSAPELVTVVGLPKGTRVLYPDPPLGKHEQEVLARSGVLAETPLQRLAGSKKLSGLRVALSLSESGDQARYGQDLLHIEGAATEIARYLAVAGATLYYGGLPATGYTETFYEMLRSYSSAGFPLERIIHHVGWPIPISKEQRLDVQKHMQVRRMKRPDGLSEADDSDFVAPHTSVYFSASKSGLHRYAWARGMTAMREDQVGDTDARVALGGKFGPTLTATREGKREEKWYSSRIPGVLEEILLTLRAGQPLYLVGGYGGCARLAADVLSGVPREEMTWKAQKGAPRAEEMRRIYEQRGEWWSYSEMTDLLRSKGVAGLNNGLEPAENMELFGSTDLSVIVSLVLKGLGNLKRKP